MTTLEELEQLFVKWDDGYYDPEPHVFRRFSKGLFNLSSFAVETLRAYEIYKQNALAQVNQENERLKQEGKNYSLGTVLPGIVEEYFTPRLFDLCYLGAWALLETYLRDVVWLVLARDSPSEGGATLENKEEKGTYCDRETLAAELVRSRRNLGDIINLYRRVLKIDIKKFESSKSLFVGRKKRNKLAHSGQALGYYSHLQQHDEWQDRAGHGADDKEAPVSEEFLCDTLIQMWKLGDFLRKQFFETRHPDSI